ncbi:shikimate kinase [Alphaproteobacteria bacterium]|jgi:shikimate kinase|nr:shikimate kinase [Alphaproteobacteria bacterium]MDC3270151.1 shikimate kinase [Alphaproteobacteria bacterium]
MPLNINNKLNISLSGMMGSGKSAIGKILANKLDYNFIDVDRMIEIDAEKTIKKIFEEDGEEYFRDLEEKITINVLEHKETIVSLGGGAIINKKIRSSIKKNSYNIYLNVDVDILTKRLQNSKTRPLIYKKNLKKQLINLISVREKFYRKADLVVKNEKNIIDTTKYIIKKIKN